MKEKIYIIFKNNEEEYDDYSDWIIEIYKDKERAENRFVELVKTNYYKKDRAIRKAKYNEDIGAYRIEEHEIENETRQNEVIDTNASSIKEDIAIIEKIITTKFNNDYSIDNKDKEAIEHILSDYKRVLKENEELEKEINGIYEDYQDLGKEYYNSIPIQKIKDKIEEYKNMLKTCNKVKDIDRIKAINERILELQELLEGRK